MKDVHEEYFYKCLEDNGQLVDVDEDTDISNLPANVTHIRDKNGVVTRIGFANAELVNIQNKNDQLKAGHF